MATIEQGKSTKQTTQKPKDDKQQQLVAQTRQNLAKINEEIKRAREIRERRYQEKEKKENEAKQVEAVKKEEKKKGPNVLERMLKGRKGSREGIQRTGG